MSALEENPAGAAPATAPNALPVINADHPVWGPRLKAIVAELVPLDPPAFTDTIVEPWRDRLMWVRQATRDLLSAMGLYVEAFNATRVLKFIPSGPMGAWVFQTDPRRSVAIQLGTLAVGFCAILESVLPEMARAFVDLNDVTRLAQKGRTVDPDITKAKEQLANWVNPTRKGDAKWAQRVADVFDISVSAEADAALSSMTQLRHGFIHERRTLLAAGIAPSDELTTWFFATQLISALASKAVSNRSKT